MPTQPAVETPKPSLAESLFGLVRNHAELASLECEYESEKGRHSFLTLGLAALFSFAAVLFLGAGLAVVLTHVGLPLYAAIFLIAAVFGLTGYLLVRACPKRDERIGQPFSASKQELKETFEWIQKRIS